MAVGDHRVTATCQCFTVGHLASWAGLCPGNDESVRQAPLQPHPQGLEMALTEAAQANTRRATLTSRRSTDGSSTYAPPARSTATPAATYFTRLDPAIQTRRLVAQLERLGHTVTLQKAAA